MVTAKDGSPFLSRRSLLIASGQVVLGMVVASIPSISRAKALGKRSLSFFHTRNQKELKITYASGAVYDRKALNQINQFLRDYNTGQVHVIDPKLLDILWAVQSEMGSKGIYEVISAYRSPKTNRGLRLHDHGVASHSLHMKGKAIDIRFSGAPLTEIKQCALAMQSGGIGYYPREEFVHLDSGQFRTW